MRRSILKIPTAYRGLMEHMTRAMGFKVVEDAEDLELSAEKIERLMQRCTQCCGQRECRGMIINAQGHMTEPPEFCLNRKAVTFLKHRAEQIEREKAKDRAAALGVDGP